MHQNALMHEKSPYLRQHAGNPVDWLPWGEAAFEKARKEDKPIFLSIGYSTCHWCHVMAHESFEDDKVAQILNSKFVPIKVDREERPDVDRIYMMFVQAFTGSGGWPMSVWLTPDLKPFFGGTYFPPASRYGRPGFAELLNEIAQSWKKNGDQIKEQGDVAAAQLSSMADSSRQMLSPSKELFESAFWQFRRMFDSKRGGFGPAPKFPRPVVFNYLLRYYAAEKNQDAFVMTTNTLAAMSEGGMHDQLGGGFHRYSVDEKWFVPHFEKMLYDQAQLAVSCLEAYQITNDARPAAVARDIFSYVLNDLKSSRGAFYSAEDADSPDPEHPDHSREGAFYVWTKQQIDDLLGPEASPAFCTRFGVRAEGNVDEDPQGEFRGQNILYQAQPPGDEATEESIRNSCSILLNARNGRPRPHRDRKVLTSWNGLMISAFARGYMLLGDEEYLGAAERAASFLLSEMYDEESGQLMRRLFEGEAAVPGFLDDYALFATACLDLFEATFDPEWLDAALAITRGLDKFEDTELGGFFSTEAGAPDLLVRVKDDYDGAEPSGNSVATDLLLRLAFLTGDTSFQRRAERSLEVFCPKIRAQPTIAPQMLVALGRSLAEPEQVIVRCAEIDSRIEDYVRQYRLVFAPNRIVLAISDEAADDLREMAPFLAGLKRERRVTIYECKNFVCQLPRSFD